MKHFADPRPRNPQGEFAGASSEGLDPQSMNVAYDPNIIAARKRVLSQKAIADLGKVNDEENSTAFSIKSKMKELAARFAPVKCPKCGEKFHYNSVPEIAMGSVACPSCKKSVSQAN